MSDANGDTRCETCKGTGLLFRHGTAVDCVHCDRGIDTLAPRYTRKAMPYDYHPDHPPVEGGYRGDK